MSSTPKQRASPVRSRVPLVPILIALAVMVGCPSDTGGPGSATKAEAIGAAQTVAGSIMLVVSHSSAWTAGSGNAVSYAVAGLTMSGTVTTSGSITTKSLSVTLTGYTDAATGYTANGTVTWTQAGTSSSQSGTVTGNVTLTGGAVTTAGFNMTFTSAGGPPIFGGTITCNGTSFEASELLEGTVNAQTAIQVIVSAISDVLGNEGSWTVSGSDVSYSPGELSMTGTRTTSGSTTTYTLTITLAGYVAGSSVYTADGTITWSVVKDTSSTPVFTSGTIGVNATLTGGAVGTETWSVTVSGLVGSPDFAGIVTLDGTRYDAKML